jgi:hypothetical protein
MKSPAIDSRISGFASKIVLPLMGAIGKVSKNALIMHIAKPVLPITTKPLNKRT